MTDRFSILHLAGLLKIILNQYDYNKTIFGVSEDLFFNPLLNKVLHHELFGRLMETPVGVAAGPHTQLAQNIVVAWLTGARFIELKTIQTLDELEISKPCIDMQDEGYNCEWSQELKINQSFDQYLNAWIIIHILGDKFGWTNSHNPGVIFNMSVGYDYDGILKNNVQWFLDRMRDSSKELTEKIESIRSIYPNIDNLFISPLISDNITLSTMHGCPPEEIEKIGEYLIIDKKLHTNIKLNPTLLGKSKLHQILKNSGFETNVPDSAFEHDLKFSDALKIIRNLQKKAFENGVQFGVKLTNTLECVNNKNIFGTHEKMMYMSGRALHPVSANLACMLQNEFNNTLNISFSGGADAFNIADLVSCGLLPVTVCSDFLKPGGYGRMKQYIEALKINDRRKSKKSIHVKLDKYVSDVHNSIDYKKTGFHSPDIKTSRSLGFFDCIHAPCVDTCPTHQGIPDYIYFTSQGNFEEAARIIRQTNPFPLTTGMVCDHLCQTKCTRINYDSPVLIREIKRFLAENSQNFQNKERISAVSAQAKKVAVIGAGPSGLTCAYYLTLAGMEVHIYESKTQPGGMVSGAIPSFRMTSEAIDIDIKTIVETGVSIHYNYPVGRQEFNELRKQNDFIYIGCGAQKSKKLIIEGIDAAGVIDPVEFLFDVKERKNTGIGPDIIIIGGGNTAMDAARTAFRLVGKKGKVTIVYRRTIKQMPADLGEIRAVIEEGIEILELTMPVRVNVSNGRVISLRCRKVLPGEKDKTGRILPSEIQDSEFDLLADTIIPAIGQQLDIDFLLAEELPVNCSYQTKIPNVFIGGDALRGASTAINAIGDGRKAAQEIIGKAGIRVKTQPENTRPEQDFKNFMVKRAGRIKSLKIAERNLNDRKTFSLVSKTLTAQEAINEASRCLLCDEVCNVCTTVCPNLAFHSYKIEPVTYQIQTIVSTENKLNVMEGGTFEVKQKYQILHIADWCNHCGNCTTFCPTAGAPFKDKPHLYLDQDIFEAEKDGYFLNNNGAPVLLYYRNNQKYQFTRMDKISNYETSLYRVSLDSETMKIIDIEIKERINFRDDLEIACEMSVILQGAVSFLQKT